MPLVEIVRGPQSSDRSVAILCEYVLGLGKKPVVVNDCPGFLVNRVLFAMLFGFEMLLAEGADYRRVDAVMENWGWPMGPAYLNDVIGIDTLNHCYASMIEGLPERFDKGELTLPSEALFKANRLGQKNGVGYYQYRVNAKGRPEKQLDEEAAAIVKSVAGSRRDVSDEEIVDRLMLPMAMEMVRCLEEKIVGSPAEADVALIYGIGFPKFRGGICRWMDQIGALQLCDLSDRYARISALYETTKEFRMRAQRGDRWYS
jgi:3-hydroxyacyl-CoA dehydrogenase/enoyl-CoA hydratase/3-hydroxybutyryl-CoA epimerase/enoyl-CoA isomerase